MKNRLLLLIALTVIISVSFIIIDSNKNKAADTEKINTINNSLGMSLVKIDAGSFIMGNERGAFDENPAHKVIISAPFYMSTSPVTNAQYEQFNKAHELLRGKRDLSFDDDEAVVFVSWYDALAFTEWLSLKEGKPYRLPTEAEWEFACRAGTTTSYNTGDSLPGVFHLNQKDEWYPKQVNLATGKTPANQWGLKNMHGLVEEWCLDWYGAYAGNTETDPAGYTSGDFKVTRGGSHNTLTEFLTSSNRSGMIPEDKNFLVGFRVVMAEMPSTKQLPVINNQLWTKDVDQSDHVWKSNINHKKPYFEAPVYFQNVPAGSNGPLYSTHNHCPDITALPNGDLFATWYSTNAEHGREMTVVAARLRKGSKEWDAPSLFFKVPDRNMHATAVWWDKSGKRIYHFQGVGISHGWGDLAMFMRTSEDNGESWSKPHWIEQEHGLRNMPIAGVIKTSDGSIMVPCDAVTGGDGGSAVHISNDDGITWYDPGAGSPDPVFTEGGSGGWIAGIHAGIVELKDGSILALGRGNSINGRMPLSISTDKGKTWAYSSSPFPPISGGQRLALIRLNEGPLLLASFTGAHNNDKGMEFSGKKGKKTIGYGLYVALSYDEGKTWPVRKLITPGTGEYDGGAWTGTFKTDANHAEPRGYLSASQSPDNVIHLISSKLHYRFNLAWLLE